MHVTERAQAVDSGGFGELSHLQFAVAYPLLNSHCAHSQLIKNAQPFSYLISSLSSFIKSYRSSSLLGMNRGIWISLCFLMSYSHTHNHNHVRSSSIAVSYRQLPPLINLDKIWILSPESTTTACAQSDFPAWLQWRVCMCVVEGGSSLFSLPVRSDGLWAWSKGDRLISVQWKENGGEPDQRACTVIFCECSLSTIPLSKSLSVFPSVSQHGAPR